VAVPGETDLDAMLASMAVARRPGVFTYAALDAPAGSLVGAAHALVVEDEGTTLVLAVHDAHDAGLDVPIELAWLTVTVPSSLAAVGLTAAFSRWLAEAGIPCNVLAGMHHDHVLVPTTRVDDAVRLLSSPRSD
jgi:hypothetical protein